MAAATAGSSTDVAERSAVGSVTTASGESGEDGPDIVVPDVVDDTEGSDAGREHERDVAVARLLVAPDGGEHGVGVDAPGAHGKAEGHQESLLAVDRLDRKS